MSWICKKCNHSNPNVNGHCFYCAHHIGIKVLKSDEDFYDESEHRENLYEIYKTEKAENLDFKHFDYPKNWKIKMPEMTEKEKLFASFFNSEKVLVKDMDDAKLKAHIEELQEIAFQARARLSAADDEARERSATRKKNKGFQTSVQTDDFTSNAIHNINERQKKMTKQEKEVERLVKMGMDREYAENLYKAKTAVAIKEHGAESVIVDQIVNSTPTKTQAFSDPFAKKVVDLKPSNALQNALDSILNPQSSPAVESKPLVSPFASSASNTPENPPVKSEENPPVEPNKEVEGLTKDLVLSELKTGPNDTTVIEKEVQKKTFNPFEKKG